MSAKPLWKCLAAEFLGTLILVYVGCSSVLKNGTSPGPQLVTIALARGFTRQALTQALGSHSSNLNPAPTLAKLVTGRIPEKKRAVLYILVQCLGGVCAAHLLKLMMPLQENDDYGVTKVNPTITRGQGLLIEMVGTFVLNLAAFALTDDRRRDLGRFTPLALGCWEVAVILGAGPMTGASFNPARSLGPSWVKGDFQNLWVYWVGPILGAVGAGLLYDNVFREEGEIKKAD